MKIVLQRVTKASVSINGIVKGKIKQGLVLLVGIKKGDADKEIKWLTNKIVNLRIFNDYDDKMNLSVKDVNGEILVISQFTLYANSKKGTRPSYIEAEKPELAIPLYHAFIKQLQQDLGKPVATGIFGANMQVSLINDGPVTILLEK
ncbi:MAG TPA: D-tyrosyl-tRNA(Tyr) deacylase [Flavobacteriia bacterium]|nr:D-tyrosyl-tRNA(Tyr) deacylase [Flavobacteriia bacterium]